MNTPLITWACIVGLFIVILLVRLWHAAIFCSKGDKESILSFMSEREEFYVPGDSLSRKENEEAYEDIEDL